MSQAPRPAMVRVLLGKELREVLRDRRTLLLTLVIPALVYPLLITGLGELTVAATLSLKARPVTLALSGMVPPDVEHALRKAEKVQLRIVPDAQAAVAARETPVGIHMGLPKTAESDPVVKLYLDAAQDESRFAADRIEQVIASVRDARLEARVKDLAVTRDYLKPLPLERSNTSSKERMKSYMASRLLPFLLIVLSLAGATATAVDTTAGERERGTLLTLMSSPVRAMEVALSKLIVVALVALAAGVANLLALGLSLSASLGRAGPDLSLEISAALVGGTLLALVPTTLYGASLLLGLAALGKTSREAQTSTAPALFLCVGLASVTVVPGLRATPLVNALPVAGPAMLMRDLIMGDATVSQVMTVMCASLVMLWLVVSFAARVLTSEPMLSSHLSVTAVLRDLAGQRVPTPLAAALVASSVLAVVVYAGPVMQGADLVLGLMGTQVLLGVVGIGSLVVLGLPWRELHGWNRRPPVRTMVAGLLAGACAFAPVMAAESWLVEVAGLKEAAEEMEKALQALGGLNLPMWQGVLLMGALPGFFEELAFRGALQGVLLRVMTPGRAIVIQAVVFGLAHQSVVRFPPTFALGLCMGLLRWRSGSPWPGVVMHSLHNGLIAAALFGGAATATLDEDAVGALMDVRLLLACIAALGVAGWLAFRTPLVRPTPEASAP